MNSISMVCLLWGGEWCYTSSAPGLVGSQKRKKNIRLLGCHYLKPPNTKELLAGFGYSMTHRHQHLGLLWIREPKSLHTFHTKQTSPIFGYLMHLYQSPAPAARTHQNSSGPFCSDLLRSWQLLRRVDESHEVALPAQAAKRQAVGVAL